MVVNFSCISTRPIRVLTKLVWVKRMDLEERKKCILGMVVSAYIKSGEPVGSKAVQNETGLNLSSATIRNEMAALENLGLLYQPHTSAGRVPSVKGYKLFVEQIMRGYTLSTPEKRHIDLFIEGLKNDLSAIMKESASVAAELTGCAAIALTPSAGGIVQLFEAVIAGKRIVTVLAVSRTGSVKTKSCLMDCDVENRETLILTKILNEVFAGMTPAEIGELRLSMLEKMILDYCPQMKSLLPVLKIFIEELKGYDVYVGGESKVLSFPEFSDISKARAIMAVLGNRQALSDIAQKSSDSITVDVFGDAEGVSDLSMIRTGFKNGDQENVLSVLGPTRLDYAKVLAQMSYFTDSITKLLEGKL